MTTAWATFSPIRVVLACLHALALLAGAGLAIAGLSIGAAEYLEEGRGWHALQLIIVGAGWLLTIIGFAAIMLKRGVSMASPILYAASCALQGFSFSALAVAIGKDGAPGPSWELASIFDLRTAREYGLELLPFEPPFVVLITIACMALTNSVSSWRGLRETVPEGA